MRDLTTFFKFISPFQAPHANGCKTVFELQQPQQRSSVSPGPRSSGANSSGYGTANSRRSVV